MQLLAENSFLWEQRWSNYIDLLVLLNGQLFCDAFSQSHRRIFLRSPSSSRLWIMLLLCYSMLCYKVITFVMPPKSITDEYMEKNF